MTKLTTLRAKTYNYLTDENSENKKTKETNQVNMS